MLGRIDRITRSQAASGSTRPKIIFNQVARVNLKSKSGCISKNGFLIKKAEHKEEKNRQHLKFKIFGLKVKSKSGDLKIAFLDNSNLYQYKYNRIAGYHAQTTIIEMNPQYHDLQKREKEIHKYDNLQLKNMTIGEYVSRPFYLDAVFFDYFATFKGNAKMCPEDDVINFIKNQQARLFVLGINLSARAKKNEKMKQSKQGEKNKTERRIDIVTARLEQIFANAGLHIVEKDIGKRYNNNHMCARFYLLERIDNTKSSYEMEIENRIFIGPIRQPIDLTE